MVAVVMKLDRVARQLGHNLLIRRTMCHTMQKVVSQQEVMKRGEAPESGEADGDEHWDEDEEAGVGSMQ